VCGNKVGQFGFLEPTQDNPSVWFSQIIPGPNKSKKVGLEVMNFLMALRKLLVSFLFPL
jgi:hypothetical protein